MLKAYLDTTVISRIQDSRDQPEQREALKKIRAAYAEGKISLLVSEVVRRELLDPRIAQYHAELLEIYGSFADVPAADPRKEPLTRMGPGISIANVRHRLWRQLTDVLVNKSDPEAKDVDAEHVFVAFYNRVQFLITHDRRTFWIHRDTLKNVIQIHATE
jgi:hypothetical protein